MHSIVSFFNSPPPEHNPGYTLTIRSKTRELFYLLVPENPPESDG